MSPNSASLRVGIFVLAGLASLLALIFFLSGTALHPGIPYETYFQESVQGLDVGTDVKFRGVTIGKVTDVGLVTAEYPPSDPHAEDAKVYQQVVVRFEINPAKIGKVSNVETAVAHGLRVQIAPQGITGLANVELSFVNPQQYPAEQVPWRANSTVIPSMPSTLNQVQDAVQKVLSALSNAHLDQMATEIASLTSALDQEITTGDAHQALANASTLLASLNTSIKAADLPATTAAVRNLADGPHTTQILTQLDETTKALAKTSAQLPALIAASQGTVNQAGETTADLQAQLGPVLRDLRMTTQNLSDLTAQLSRNPASAILAPAPPPDAHSTQGANP